MWPNALLYELPVKPTVFTAGDFKNQAVYYKLTAIPCRLSLGKGP
jgi:hypothetical protein